MDERSLVRAGRGSVSDWQSEETFLFRLQRSARITRKTDIDRVFKYANLRRSSGVLTVLALTNNVPCTRLAVAVPKRLVSRAVNRNRIKRIVREWFRLHYAQLQVADVVFLLRRPIQHIGEVRQALNDLSHYIVKDAAHET